MHDKPLEIAAAFGATRVLKATDAEAIAGATRGGTVGLPPRGDQPVPVASAITRERLAGSLRFNNAIDEEITAFATAADASVSGKVLLAF
ncbi:hypothetical protein [Amycolatopsis saalfeldensis]|uniref:L-idonate 5-dehydrogenase n=1 Tax=Amycolatopsis saalfeldensis TaxID=394193 RepID=A0A1H8XE31_9PSEU|nr:hypothetical protein [Amycolatopsis saalfeldensis]SEP38190.1 L-idonate 5-dehydrogenase [Amycolatopsis saalfeldensis]